MKYIHNAKITIFLKPEEYHSAPELIIKIKNIFHKLLPIDFDKEKIVILEEQVESFENRKIKIFTLEFSKESQTKVFLKTFKDLIRHEQCKTLVTQKESRLDEELFFYVRLDKEAALKEVFELTDSGDCVHIKMHVAAFPTHREPALKTVEEMFSK